MLWQKIDLCGLSKHLRPEPLRWDPVLATTLRLGWLPITSKPFGLLDLLRRHFFCDGIAVFPGSSVTAAKGYDKPLQGGDRVTLNA